MKMRVCSSPSWYLLLSLLVLSWPRPAIGQFSFPTVTLYATDPFASEIGGDTGTFTVRRAGPTNFPLLVFYQLGGTASNGVDYELLGNTVQIPPGALEASFIVKPIADSLADGTETVTAQITGSPLACATCGYNIGVPSNAVVTIADNDNPATNHPPFVRLDAPQNGQVFAAHSDIQLVAFAQDVEDGYFLKVEFFEGTNDLGAGTFNPTRCATCPNYILTWSNVVAGDYVLTARAADHQGAMTVSPPVHVFVVDTNAVPQPVVNIYATDDTGSEIPVVPPWLDIAQRVDPAVFTVTRSGPTNSPLAVFYNVGGTASNGVDYVLLPGSTIIPAGASSANIEVVVIDDLLVEGTETVELTLAQLWCFVESPDCYLVGPSNQAVAYILDNDLTPPPVVTIVATDPNASESGPDTGTFTVSRTGDTTHPLPVFYTIGGTAQIGVDYLKFTNFVLFPFLINLPDLEIPAGASSADITVTPIEDNLVEGSETVVLQLQQPAWGGYLVGAPSNAVVTIAENDATQTNHPPFVRLNAPQDGDVFIAPADIALRAYAQDAEDGFNLKVEFFEGTNSLGFGVFVPTLCPSPYCPFFALTWSNVPPGHYTLTAHASDSLGAVGVSAPVSITVVTNPPPTNLPPVVNIVARDPFASEGTNFWLGGWETNHWNLDLWNWWHVNLGGTNTATFVVRRHGPTNDDLTVSYAIGGTASNGLDYVALPGAVTIPAGKHTAQIVVAPIDDNLVEGIETVVLTLQLSPDYIVGFPSHATAFIIDEDRPRPPCMLLPDHEFHFCEPATNGFCFRVEASTDLLHWIPLCTNVVTDGALHFVDPDAPPLNLRFYRAAPEAALPPDD